MVLGSVEIFGDDWLDKEENAKLCDVLFSWLLNETDLDMTSDRQVGRSTTLSVFVFIFTDRYGLLYFFSSCDHPCHLSEQSTSTHRVTCQILITSLAVIISIYLTLK